MSNFSEQSFHQWLAESFHKTSSTIQQGVGDDAAIIQINHTTMALCSDTITDGVHFSSDQNQLDQIGWKAAAVSISDLAAVAADPVGLLINLQIPSDQFSKQSCQQIYRGIQALTDQFNGTLLGGDTIKVKHDLALSTTALGTCPHGAVLRKQSRSNQNIYVSGATGGSFPDRHLTFTPRVELGLTLAKNQLATSMIDISDGLVKDLERLLPSGNGALLQAQDIPIHPDAKNQNNQKGPSPLEKALYDGEDFELLFTAKANKEKTLEKTTSNTVKKIGTVTNQPHIYLQQKSRKKRLEPDGYQHFS